MSDEYLNKVNFENTAGGTFSETYKNTEENLSEYEITELIKGTGDDIDKLITQVIPSLPPLFTKANIEINKEDLLESIQMVRQGLNYYLGSITSRYGLRETIRNQIVVEELTKEVSNAESLNDVANIILLNDLTRINGEEFNKAQLKTVFDTIYTSIESQDYQQLDGMLQFIGRMYDRYGIPEKVETLIKEALYEKKYGEKEVSAPVQEVDSIPKADIEDFKIPTREEMVAEYNKLLEEYATIKREIPDLDQDKISSAKVRMAQLRKILNDLLKTIEGK